jgi:threonine dehydrogenase-like Zn-dependent dehydrogenase
VRGVFLPGGSKVEIREVADPRPGHGQVVLSMRASTICGSDLRAIYREHLGSGPEAYQGVIGGHEPSGVVEAVGPGVNRIRPGDRVVVYHISGCGQCDECRRGYQISCTSPRRAAIRRKRASPARRANTAQISTGREGMALGPVTTAVTRPMLC